MEEEEEEDTPADQNVLARTPAPSLLPGRSDSPARALPRLWFRLEFRVWDLEFTFVLVDLIIEFANCPVSGLGFSLWFRVQGSGFRI